MAKPKLIAAFERTDGGIDWQWRDGAWRPKLPRVDSSPSNGVQCYWVSHQRMPLTHEWIEVVWGPQSC